MRLKRCFDFFETLSGFQAWRRATHVVPRTMPRISQVHERNPSDLFKRDAVDSEADSRSSPNASGEYLDQLCSGRQTVEFLHFLCDNSSALAFPCLSVQLKTMSCFIRASE